MIWKIIKVKKNHKVKNDLLIVPMFDLFRVDHVFRAATGQQDENSNSDVITHNDKIKFWITRTIKKIWKSVILYSLIELIID